MPDQFSSSNNGSVTVYIYEPELNYLKWLVLQKRKIETGGDLFGLWQDEGTAVVQLILGPGKGCSRTTTSFHQDVAYLEEVGGYLTSSQGLCNIGEWHSHHTLGLAEPSYGDQQTVWNHISSVAGGRFLVFIANIRGTPAKVNFGCFLFNLSEQKITRGKIKGLPCANPVRLTVENAYLTSKAEAGQDWTTFMRDEQSVKIENSVVPNEANSELRNRRDESATNDESFCEESYNDKDTLLPTESSEEEELSTCGKLSKRLRQMFTSAMAFLRRWCRRCCRCCNCRCNCCCKDEANGHVPNTSRE